MEPVSSANPAVVGTPSVPTGTKSKSLLASATAGASKSKSLSENVKQVSFNESRTRSKLAGAYTENAKSVSFSSSRTAAQEAERAARAEEMQKSLTNRASSAKFTEHWETVQWLQANVVATRDF